jgi:hypothetical protein
MESHDPDSPVFFFRGTLRRARPDGGSKKWLNASCQKELEASGFGCSKVGEQAHSGARAAAARVTGSPQSRFRHALMRPSPSATPKSAALRHGHDSQPGGKAGLRTHHAGMGQEVPAGRARKGGGSHARAWVQRPEFRPELGSYAARRLLVDSSQRRARERARARAAARPGRLERSTRRLLAPASASSSTLKLPA